MTEIRYITPFSTERNKHGYPNIGGEYNKCINELPDDCWVVLMDQDVLPLTSDFGNHVAEIIEANQHLDLIGCMTNRVGINQLCVSKELFNETDITVHIAKSNELWQLNGTKTEPFNLVPGYFMLFRKSLWEKVVGFPEFDITFDRVFSSKVIKSGGKIGIATGLYLFHLYRFGEINPKQSVKHLVKTMKPQR